MRVAVALSGGIDSFIAAALLKEQGKQVFGITMALPTVTSTDFLIPLKEMTRQLGIPHYIIDCSDYFEQQVINYFCREYLAGRTPGPCVICNQKLKFGILLEKARALGADYLASGHFARRGWDEAEQCYFIKKAVAKEKDQSYFLFSLTPEQLKYILFPIGEMSKEEVRQLKHKMRLSGQESPESQELCFIANNDYREFLRKRLDTEIKSGIIVNKTGKVLGIHQGVPFYTIGQRRQLGIAAGKPLYVIGIDAQKNTIIVGEKADLYKKELIAADVNFAPMVSRLKQPLLVTARIRYRHPGAPATIYPLGKDRIRVKFAEPQLAVTPGQAVVFYDGEVLLGGGWIA